MPLDRDAISTVVGRVLFNNLNYPEAVQARTLGQDTSMLRGLIVNAVMDLVQSGKDVTLTREEAALAAHALSALPVDRTRVHYTKYLALSKRLEASL